MNVNSKVTTSKRIVSLILAISLVCSLSLVVHAETNAPEVTYIDNNGDFHTSSKPVEFFLELAEDSPSTRMIPTVDDDSIRISDTVVRTLTKSQADSQISSVISDIFGLVWGSYGGKLFDVITKATIKESVWKGFIASKVVDTAITSVISHINYTPLSTKSYQYKTWSNYYNCYLVYQVIIYYNDTALTNVKAVDYWVITTQSNSEVKIG